MASDMKKPMGITVLTRSNLKELMWPLDIQNMFGIGKKTTIKLKEAGINTIKDIADYSNYDILRQIVEKMLYYYIEKLTVLIQEWSILNKTN